MANFTPTGNGKGNSLFNNSKAKVATPGSNTYTTSKGKYAAEAPDPKAIKKIHKAPMPKNVISSSSGTHPSGGTGNGYAEKDTSSLFHTGGATYGGKGGPSRPEAASRPAKKAAPKRKSYADTIPLPALVSHMDASTRYSGLPGFADGGSVGAGTPTPTTLSTPLPPAVGNPMGQHKMPDVMTNSFGNGWGNGWPGGFGNIAKGIGNAVGSAMSSPFMSGVVDRMRQQFAPHIGGQLPPAGGNPQPNWQGHSGWHGGIAGPRDGHGPGGMGHHNDFNRGFGHNDIPRPASAPMQQPMQQPGQMMSWNNASGGAVTGGNPYPSYGYAPGYNITR